MPTSIPDATRVLRDDAWHIVMESEAFVMFKALDDAYTRMGGSSRIADDPSPLGGLVRAALNIATKRVADNRRMSHAETAEIALRKAGIPMTTPDLMEAAKEVGADIGGSDPLNNFRSSVSREGKFKSVKKDGTSYWWIKDEDLPLGWNDPVGPSLLDAPTGPSVSSKQEGGDGHGPATT